MNPNLDKQYNAIARKV